MVSVPREIKSESLTDSAAATSVSFLAKTVQVEAVEGNLYRFKVKTVTPNGSYDVDAPQPDTGTLTVSLLSPATKYEFELENENQCAVSSAVSTRRTVCTRKKFHTVFVTLLSFHITLPCFFKVNFLYD